MGSSCRLSLQGYEQSEGPGRHEDGGSLRLVVGMIYMHLRPLKLNNPWLFKKVKRSEVEDNASGANGVLIVTELTKWGEKGKEDAGRGLARLFPC